MKPSAGAIGPLVPAMAWTVALMIAAPAYMTTGHVFLTSLGLLLNATVAVTGMVVVGGRWAHRLGWGIIAICGLLAVVRPIDAWWWVGLGSILTGAVLLLAAAAGIRRLPAATGPGGRAVMVTLTLLLAPVVVGLTGVAPDWAALTLGLGGPVFAFLYSRVIFGGLIGVRIIWPLLALVLALFMDWPDSTLPVVLGAAVAAFAWHPSVKVAFHPPREVGSTFPIPPELAPTEILDAARIDDRGRPQ